MTTHATELDFEGTTYRPGDAGYDEARHGWNRSMDSYPAVLFIAKSVEDVQAAVQFAIAHDLPIAVRNTGHGAHRNADGAALICVAGLNHVTIDAEAGTARIGGGAMWSDVIGPAYEAGFGVPCGSSPGVGVVGYTLGGGYGLMARKYGLAVDHVQSMKVVLASGELVTASATEHADLFWSLCGGGGAVGVVVEIEMSLPREAQVFGGMVMYPADLASDVFRAYHGWTQDLDESVTSAFYVIAFPPVPFVPAPLQGRAFACVSACAVGEHAEQHLDAIRTLPGVFMDSFRSMPFTETAEIFRDPVDPMPAWGTGVLLHDLPSDRLDAFLAANGEPGLSPLLKLEIRQLGGAVARREVAETAIGERRTAKYIAFGLGVPMPGSDAQRIHDHALNVFAALDDAVMCPGPLNWLGEATVTSERIRASLGEGFERLVAIKAEYDPQNRFRFAGAGACLESK